MCVQLTEVVVADWPLVLPYLVDVDYLLRLVSQQTRRPLECLAAHFNLRAGSEPETKI